MRWWWHGGHSQDAWISSQNVMWCKQRDDDIKRCEPDVSPVLTQSQTQYLSSANLRNGWNQHLGFCFSRWLKKVKTLWITNVLLESVTSGNLVYWFLIGVILALIVAWVLQTSIFIVPVKKSKCFLPGRTWSRWMMGCWNMLCIYFDIKISISKLSAFSLEKYH